MNSILSWLAEKSDNLSEVVYEQLVDRIELFDRSMDKFDIVKSILLDVTRIYESLFSLLGYNKYPEFINIFFVFGNRL